MLQLGSLWALLEVHGAPAPWLGFTSWDEPLTWTWMLVQAVAQPPKNGKRHWDSWEQFREGRVGVLPWTRPLLRKGKHERRNGAYWLVSLSNNGPLCDKKFWCPAAQIWPLGPGPSNIYAAQSWDASTRLSINSLQAIFVSIWVLRVWKTRLLWPILCMRPWAKNSLNNMVYSPIVNLIIIYFTLALNRNE